MPADGRGWMQMGREKLKAETGKLKGDLPQRSAKSTKGREAPSTKRQSPSATDYTDYTDSF